MISYTTPLDWVYILDELNRRTFQLIGKYSTTGQPYSLPITSGQYMRNVFQIKMAANSSNKSQRCCLLRNPKMADLQYLTK